MLKECRCEQENDFYIVNRTRSFPPPSGAEVFCLGRTSERLNGLDKRYRK